MAEMGFDLKANDRLIEQAEHERRCRDERERIERQQESHSSRDVIELPAFLRTWNDPCEYGAASEDEGQVIMARQHDIIRQSLRELSHVERVSMLLVSVIEHQPQVYEAATGVLQVFSAMSRGLSGFRRLKLANQLTGLAEQLKNSNVEGMKQ
ncbi:hypothetical protein M2202_009646 [Bradyrhizobium japonicum]|uniref:hypothetical protein n=1 Tax=Bradyrhizobium japonicum TaxID=375 RepID=UPI0020A16F63|nr:hypothetical protein [Bradyrhizobium japonicum]MCP1768867.1 hypothetical protein [Bradyrhizobium japonicum]MCP1811433.1 hypothetical protein [Bradyrhizobium japonicum]MCP1876662.1 hypothetical protein [Bradyrhizobium japonicum]MCP1886449.1 hypothetical protein [Bradyrhizobium japonicum]MCP1954800.1 hypothetical protein [Bradyrhizobium japonicum]